MRNLAEKLPEKQPQERGESEDPEKERLSGEIAEVFDILTKRRLTPKEIDRLKEHPSWQVSIGEKGEILGLPQGVSQKDVVVFLGSDGKWYAQNPSPELMEEKRLWRSDWEDDRKAKGKADDKKDKK